MKFDEFSVGQAFETGFYQMTKEDIMNFARAYDPLYLHLDEEKAKQGLFKGIIASGIHTLAVSYKLWVELGIFGENVIAGTGMKHIKFIKPVYPGDELQTMVEVVDKQPVNQDTGKITILLSSFNRQKEKVFEGELSVLIKR